MCTLRRLDINWRIEPHTWLFMEKICLLSFFFSCSNLFVDSEVKTFWIPVPPNVSFASPGRVTLIWTVSRVAFSWENASSWVLPWLLSLPQRSLFSVPAVLHVSEGELPDGECFSWHDQDHSLSDRVLQNTRACLCLPCSQSRETFTLTEMKCHVQRPLLEWHDISSAVPYIDFDRLKAFPLKSDIMHIFVDPSHQLTVISFGRHDSEQRNLTVTNHTRFHHIAVYIERIYWIHIDHWIRLYLIVSKWGNHSHP